MWARWGRGISLASAVMVLNGIRHVSGHSQLVMEQTFFMETSACDGMSCRKEIIGANETLGVGAVATCSKRTTYWKGNLNHAPMGQTELFELWYSCRKEAPSGEHVMLMSWEECGMVAEPCLDVGADPDNFEVTYQVAFEFKSEGDRAAYDVSVDVKLYMRYLKVDDDFYTLRSKDPARCVLGEACHRRCDPGELVYIAELGDSMGDGWNAGGINHFDHFRLESRSELTAIVAADMAPPTNGTDKTDAAAAAAVRRTSYKNTMPGGSSRRVPLCLSDGEYFFSTEFHEPELDPHATYGTYSAPDAVFSVGGRLFSESSWTFCGHTGMLSDHTHVRVSDGVCVAIGGWEETAAPSATPVVGATLAPTPAPTTATNPAPATAATHAPITFSPTSLPTAGTDDGSATGGDINDGDATDHGGGDGGDGGNDGEGDSGGDGGGGDGGGDGDGDGDATDGDVPRDNTNDEEPSESSLNELEIWGIGMGAVGLAGLAAAGGTYAQKKGWFAPAGAAGGAAAAGGSAGGGGAPNPDVDEFAP